MEKSSSSSSGIASDEVYPVSSSVYGDRLKIECLYNVLHEYSFLMRPGVFVNDNKLCFLLAMCRMIDRSNELRVAEKDGTDGTSTSVGDGSVDDEFDEWKMDALETDWADLFVDTNTAATPATRGVSVTDRMDLFESMVLRDEYL